jgi:hypothetical protein
MKRFKTKTLALTAAFAVVTAFSGCKAGRIPSGLTANATPSSSAAQTTAEASSAASPETQQTKASSEDSKLEETFNADSYNKKREAIKGNTYAIGTTYLGESQNEAALEVVLAEMGVDEGFLKSNPGGLVDCGGTDIWFLCFNEEVTSVTVVMGDEDDGKEIFKSANPGFIFIRCVSAGEVPACTVIVDGPKTGHTAYYPFMVADQILLPNGGTVLNQSEGIDSYIDEYEDPNNSGGTEVEEP